MEKDADRDETKRTEAIDRSYERFWATEKGYVKRLSILSKKIKIHFIVAFLSQSDPRRYLKSNISENSHLISTNKVSKESSPLQLLNLRKSIIFFF